MAANRARPTGPFQVLALLGFLLGCFLAAGLGSAATSASVGTWYPTINRPAWTPPDWVFGPVWTALYAMMAVAAWLVWRRTSGRDTVVAMTCFGLQLTLNVAWSVIFFGLRSPGLALIEIVLLWLAIAGTIVVFRRHSTVAAALLVPYLGWSTFAAVLNFALWRMNA